MRIFFLILLFSLAQSFAQTAPKTKKTKAAKAKASAKSAAPASTKPSEPPTAIFDTSMGQISCVLFPDKAPKTVANFVGLALGTKEWTDPFTGQKNAGKPLFDGTTFHRVIPNFMVQGGDPLGTGTGGPGYRFEDELRDDLGFDKPGRLAMANSGPGTNGSQFFITEVPTPHLNPCFDEGGCPRGPTFFAPKGFGHTIFGQCDEPSVEVVRTIARVATDPRDNKPLKPVTINKVAILGVEQPKKPRPARAKKKAAPKD
jgi:peptidyl-prolyl cis-trans isomerase A (cyclophilin A)